MATTNPKTYPNWRFLNPIAADVPVGTKCVVIATIDGHQFKRGQVVVRCETEDKYTDGLRSWIMSHEEIALLPTTRKNRATIQDGPPTMSTTVYVQKQGGVTDA